MAGVAGRLAKIAAVALLGATFHTSVPLVLSTSPAFAQTIPAAPPANASPAQKQAWARQAVIAIAAYYSSRVTEGAQFSEAIQNLLLANPTLAGELATVIVAVGDRTSTQESGGVTTEVFISPSMSVALANGLAYAVSTWQAQVNANPAASSVAQAALTAVNGAFAAAELSPGSLFARTFASAASETGNRLLPPSLVEPDSPEALVQLTVLPPVKTPSNNVPSPNRPRTTI